jgi:hypothetical protein
MSLITSKRQNCETEALITNTIKTADKNESSKKVFQLLVALMSALGKTVVS